MELGPLLDFFALAGGDELGGRGVAVETAALRTEDKGVSNSMSSSAYDNRTNKTTPAPRKCITFSIFVLEGGAAGRFAVCFEVDEGLAAGGAAGANRASRDG